MKDTQTDVIKQRRYSTL